MPSEPPVGQRVDPAAPAVRKRVTRTDQARKPFPAVGGASAPSRPQSDEHRGVVSANPQAGVPVALTHSANDRSGSLPRSGPNAITKPLPAPNAVTKPEPIPPPLQAAIEANRRKAATGSSVPPPPGLTVSVPTLQAPAPYQGGVPVRSSKAAQSVARKRALKSRKQTGRQVIESQQPPSDPRERRTRGVSFGQHVLGRLSGKDEPESEPSS